MNNSSLTASAVSYLKKPLHPAVVRDLPGKRGRDGSPIRHVEGHYVIDRLNQIFGFDGWSVEVLDLTQIHAELAERPGRQPLWIVVYRATIRLTIHCEPVAIVREDVATGDGQTPGVGDAHDLAVKTAATTALKRAARTLGSQFGNSLYGDHDLRYRDDLYLGADPAPPEAPAPSASHLPPVPGLAHQRALAAEQLGEGQAESAEPTDPVLVSRALHAHLRVTASTYGLSVDAVTTVVHAAARRAARDVATRSGRPDPGAGMAWTEVPAGPIWRLLRALQSTEDGPEAGTRDRVLAKIDAMARYGGVDVDELGLIDSQQNA